jgi:hypothetical protein
LPTTTFSPQTIFLTQFEKHYYFTAYWFSLSLFVCFLSYLHTRTYIDPIRKVAMERQT